MNHAQRKLRMKTTKVDVEEKPVIVGILRKYGSTKMMEAPSVVKSFNEENGTNVRLIRPTTADCLLVKTDRWKDVSDAFPLTVDLAIAYEKLEQEIGDTVVWAEEGKPRVILATTGNAKGERDVAILVPDITAEDVKREGNGYVIDVPQDRLVIVPDFPHFDDWYDTYENTTVPCVDTVYCEHEARYLNRTKSEERDKPYVGLLVRDKNYDDYDRRCVSAEYWPSDKFGVAVEIPEEDAEKFCGNIQNLPIKELNSLIINAQASVEKMTGNVEAALLEPVKNLLRAIDNTDSKE